MKFFKIILTSIIGFIILALLAVGGMFYLKSSIDTQLNPPKTELIQRTEKIGDFSKIPQTYKVTKALNLLGVTAVVAEYPKTGQYMAIIDTGWAMSISKTDIQTGSLTQKLTDYALKVSSPNMKLNNLEITPKGTFKSFNQSVPYAQIKVKISGLNSEKIYDGMVGIVFSKSKNSNELVISVNKKGTFDQKIAENFFKKVQIQ